MPRSFPPRRASCDGVNQQVASGAAPMMSPLLCGAIAQHGTSDVRAVAVVVLRAITARAQTEEAQVDADGGKDRMPVMWSRKSGCMLELLTPLSSPVSATVTMMPLPSRPTTGVNIGHVGAAPVSSTFMT